MDHRGVNHHVVVDEFGWPGGIGHDAADGAGNQVNILGPVGAEPVIDGGLISQIELVACRGLDVFEAQVFEAANDRGADEPAMTGDEDA